MTARRWLLLGGLALASRSADAQVGYPPDRSPFRDLPQTMELSMYSGWFKAKRDPGGVAPRSGPMVGAMWQWRFGGPSNLVADVGLSPKSDHPRAVAACELVLEGLAAAKRISRTEELGYTRARPERREPGYGKGGISFG